MQSRLPGRKSVSSSPRPTSVRAPARGLMNGNPDLLPFDLRPLGLPRPELEQLFAGLGEKPFRARQLMRWMYGRGVLDPVAMTDLSGALRETLGRRADLQPSRHRHGAGIGRRHDQVAPGRRRGTADRDGVYPGRGAGHAVRVVAGGLCSRLLVLRNRTPGFQSQSDGGRDRRPGRAGNPGAGAGRPGVPA